MRSLNQVMLMGHLAADPELRQTKSGLPVANFSVATNRTALVEGQKQEFADFHRIVAWGKLAETCDKYIKKGTGVFVEGKIINRSFEDKSGVRHYRTEIVADQIYILTWSKSRSGEGKVGLENVIKEREEEPELAEV